MNWACIFIAEIFRKENKRTICLLLVLVKHSHRKHDKFFHKQNKCISPEFFIILKAQILSTGCDHPLLWETHSPLPKGKKAESKSKIYQFSANGYIIWYSSIMLMWSDFSFFEKSFKTFISYNSEQTHHCKIEKFCWDILSTSTIKSIIYSITKTNLQLYLRTSTHILKCWDISWQRNRKEKNTITAF